MQNRLRRTLTNNYSTSSSLSNACLFMTSEICYLSLSQASNANACNVLPFKQVIMRMQSNAAK